MEKTTNKHICRLLTIITNDSLSFSQVLQRVGAIYGVSVVVIVVRWRRKSHGQRLAMLKQVTQNSSLLTVLFSGFPLIYKLTANKLVSFNVVLSAYSFSQVPSSVTGYVVVESVADWLRNLPSFTKITQGCHETTLNFIRQCALCLIVPLLYHTRRSRARDLMFRPRSPVKDFILVFSLWNTISLYQFVKSSLYKKDFKQHRKSVDNAPEQAVYPPNSRFLVDKLREIRELNTSRSALEKIASCFFGENLTVSLKWTAWRQLLWALFKSKSSLCSHIQASVMLIMGFLILDGNGVTCILGPVY